MIKSVSAAISRNVFDNLHRDDIKIMSETACGLVWYGRCIIRLRFGLSITFVLQTLGGLKQNIHDEYKHTCVCVHTHTRGEKKKQIKKNLSNR